MTGDVTVSRDVRSCSPPGYFCAVREKARARWEQLEADPVARSENDTPLKWQHFALSDVGVEDTAREDGSRWILNFNDVSADQRYTSNRAQQSETLD